MVKAWKKDKAWSDKFIPKIRGILGQVFFSLPTIADDQMKNTDLICMDMSGARIGCRVRKKIYLKQYPFQFTIRYSRPMGTSTEYQKIIDGWGDYFFYGFSNNAEDDFLMWIIGDLKIFRKAMSGGDMGILRKNYDLSSDFKAFDWQSMPPNFFVGISPPELIMTDTCDKCFSEKIVFQNRPNWRICTQCMSTYDYSLMIDVHRKTREIAQYEKD